MSDLLVDLGTNPTLRRWVRQLGLPVPLPQKLRREAGPWGARPLQDRAVVVLSGAGASLGAVIAGTLAPAGAVPYVVGEPADAEPYRGPGEAWGRPATVVPAGDAPEGLRADAIVFDASGLSGPPALRALYDGLHPWVSRLAPNGRVVVLGRNPHAAGSVAAAAAAAGLEGFTRSLAKEIGRRGATAHVVYVGANAEGRVAPLLRFLLSDRASFLTGQPWYLDAHVPAPAAVPFVRPLEGRTALVTGAARGIGEAIARGLAAEGAHVVCLDRPGDDEALAGVARAVDGMPLLLDITDADAPTKLVRSLADRDLRLDVVVHNAGVTRDRTLGNMSPEQWDQAVAVNLDAVLRLDAALIEDRVNDGARLVCLSSVAGLAGNAGQTNYAAAKSGLVGYVRAAAGHLAPRGITLNAVAPGFIETRLTRAIPAVNREVARRLSALSQGGEPGDVAELVVFLASPGASGLTAQVVRACGGMFIGA